MPTRDAACPAAPESLTQTLCGARPRPGRGSAGHKGTGDADADGPPPPPAPAPRKRPQLRDGPGAGIHSPRSARRRRRALLGAGPGGRGTDPRAAARALLWGRRPPRRLLGHCRRFPYQAGGPGAGPASAAPAPASAPGLAGSARYSGPPRMPPSPLSLRLTRGRLRAAGRDRRAARAGRSGAVLTARGVLRGGGGGPCGCAGEVGAQRAHPDALPPPLRRAHLGAAALPFVPGRSLRLQPFLPDPWGAVDRGRRGEGPRAGGSVCDGFSRAVRAGWSSPEPVCGQRGCLSKKNQTRAVSRRPDHRVGGNGGALTTPRRSSIDLEAEQKGCS